MSRHRTFPRAGSRHGALRPAVFWSLSIAVLVAVVAWFSPPERLEAVSAGDVLGTYQLKLKGDGWLINAGTQSSGRSRVQRVRGTGWMIVTGAEGDSNDGRVNVEIRLGADLEGSGLDQSTGSPDFQGKGFLVDDFLTVIDSGASIFVNAISLRFAKRGKKVTGMWIVSKPPTATGATDGSFAAAAGITVRGKRIRIKPNRPAPEIPPADSVSLPGSR